MHKNELLVGITGAVAVKLLVYMKGKNAKKFRQGVEYGSARWGTAKDIAPFIDPVFENNILLTMTERLTMNGRPKNPKFARNKNVIVIGGSGSGKTRFYVKPNLMQMGKYISYVVTDPKGTIIIECGKMLVRHGYKVKVLNTINFSKSMHYNPFHYIHSEKDILKLVNTIMVNTKGEGEKSSEDFWTKAERLLYCALIGYIWYEAPEEEQNFAMLIDLIDASEAREDDENFKNPVDLLFDELEEKDPHHFAVRQYKKYKLAAGETKWSFFKLLLYSIDGIVAFSTAPVRFAAWIGLFFCMLAFIFIVVIVVRTLMFGDPVAGWPSMLCVILLLSGIQLFCLGLLGEYLSKTYLEVKKRPIYLSKESSVERGEEGKGAEM